MIIRVEKEREILREGGKRLAIVRDKLVEAVRPGVNTNELNDLAEKLIREQGDEPAFLNYTPSGAERPYPATLCVSINDEIVHGIPNEGAQVLKEGDIIGLDFGVILNGWYSDTAITIGVGEISHEARRLINVTKKALRLGIKKAKPGSTTGDIGNTIERYVESEGYSIVRDLVGHGVGKNLHEEPQVPNWGKRHTGTVLEPGMVIAIEPMVIAGTSNTIKLAPDKFGYKSADGSLTAHFENTVAISEQGPQILTQA